MEPGGVVRGKMLMGGGMLICPGVPATTYFMTAGCTCLKDMIKHAELFNTHFTDHALT